MSERSRKDLILDKINDLVANFLYYDRKEDEDLSAKDIEKAVEDGEITVEDMVARFRSQLEPHLGNEGAETDEPAAAT